MMNANELRIGNWVRWFDESETPVQVMQFRTENGVWWLTFAESLQSKTNTVLMQEFAPIPLTEEILLKIEGVEKLPHPTIQRTHFIRLSRNRVLSFANVATPNEMIFLSEVDPNDFTKINELVVIRNYDYDGYTPLHEVQNIYYSIEKKELEINL